MKKKATVSETLREILLLEGFLKEITQLSDEAFSAFDPLRPLDEMNGILESSWKKLDAWNRTHEKAPHFYMQGYNEIRGIFCSVTSASINRDEFKKALTESCEAIEEGIKKIQSKLSEEEKQLDELYKEFAQDTGDLKFIFEEESVKKLIMSKLLKS